MFAARRLLLASSFAGTLLAISLYQRIARLPSKHYSNGYVDASMQSSESTNDSFRNQITAIHAKNHPAMMSFQSIDKSFSQALVIPRMSKDATSWIRENLAGLNVIVYVPDDAAAELHPPKNKGHEVMVYFSYIIDHFECLPDVVVFLHSHRFTHHNNEILGFDAVQMLRHLKLEHVIKQGYFNMRCSWSPGCPRWLRPNPVQEVLVKQEEAVLTESWQELFPQHPVPETLAQACCAQFAVSAETIRSIAKSRYIYYRDWLMKTPLNDYVSGRIWEYTWQYLFATRAVACPPEHVCYCDGFGVCFEGSAAYNFYERLLAERFELESKLKEFKQDLVI